MSNWIERPGDSRVETSPEETALRETYLAACKIAFGLGCALETANTESPDVVDCAALLREAVRKPEKERDNAVKAAKLAVQSRQAVYIARRTGFLLSYEAWRKLRPTLVAQLEAVAVPKEEPRFGGQQHLHYGDVDLYLNCENVAALIESCDIAVNEWNRRRYSRPTDKHAEAGFQAVFDALVAECTAPSWMGNARLTCYSRHSYTILDTVACDKIAPTYVAADLPACNALEAARAAFEEAASWANNQKVRDFNQETRGTFNDVQMAESLLDASGDLSRLVSLENQRDEKMLKFWLSWRAIRHQVESEFAVFERVAELLPAACAEAAAIEDENLRRQAQVICLFAARRMKENIKFLRENDRFSGERDVHFNDTSAVVARRRQALIARLKSGELRTPSTKVREVPDYGY